MKTGSLQVNGQYGNVPAPDITAAATTVVNWNEGNARIINMGVNITTLTLQNPVKLSRYLLNLVHVGGPRSVTWPATVNWGEAGVPDFSTRAAGKQDVISLFWNGTQYLAGLNPNY